MKFIRGRVVTGLGEGRYYLSREGYRKQFKQKLGFDPYPGTLNLKLSEPFCQSSEGSIEIEGFNDEGRAFGGCRCYLLMIRDVRCAAVRPERSRYPPDLVEIIAPVNLRKALGLYDGDTVDMVLER